MPRVSAHIARAATAEAEATSTVLKDNCTVTTSGHEYRPPQRFGHDYGGVEIVPEAIIGEGVFGCVYKVYAVQTQKYFAMKCPKNVPVNMDDHRILAVEFELETLTILVGCPFITAVAGISTDTRYRPSIPLIVLPLAEYGSLGNDKLYESQITETTYDAQQKSKSDQQLCLLMQILDICLQIAHGLVYAHEKNVIHANINPKNVLMMRKRDVRGVPFKLWHINLCNFSFNGYRGKGGASSLGHYASCREREDFWVPGYHAPELESEESEVTPKVDVWGLSSLLSTMLNYDTTSELSSEKYSLGMRKELWTHLENESIEHVNRVLVQCRAHETDQRLDMRSVVVEMQHVMAKICSSAGLSECAMLDDRYYDGDNFMLEEKSITDALTMSARFYMEVRQDFDKTEVMYERAIERDPTNANALNKYGSFLETVRKRYIEAETLFERAVEANPHDASALNNLGNFLYNVRKSYDRAETMFNRAVAAEPMHVSALCNYGSFLYTIRKKHDEAEFMYKRAVAAGYKNAGALNNYGYFLYIVRKNYDDAESMYEQAVEADPYHVSALNNYGNFLYTVRKKYDEAEIMFERALEVNPNYFNALCNYGGFLYTVWESYDEAEAMYERALATDPNHTGALNNVAISLLRPSGLTPERVLRAKELATRVLELDPEHSEAPKMLDIIADYEIQNQTKMKFYSKQKLKLKVMKTSQESTEISQDAIDEADKNMQALLLEEEEEGGKTQGKGTSKGKSKGKGKGKGKVK